MTPVELAAEYAQVASDLAALIARHAEETTPLVRRLNDLKDAQRAVEKHGHLRECAAHRGGDCNCSKLIFESPGVPHFLATLK